MATAARARSVLAALAVGSALGAVALTAGGRTADPWSAPRIPYAVQPATPAFDFDEVTDARDERPPVSHKPTVQAAFTAESYRPGATAHLEFFGAASRVVLKILRVGEGTGRWGNDILGPSDVMRGTPVDDEQFVGDVAPGRRVAVRIGAWSSALYFAELTASGGRVGYAPFVVAPARLGEHRIGVVLPTQTWQAYNYRDDDGDGRSDTWYFDPNHITTARLYRPFENRGVPPHYKYYDEPFLRWLVREGIDADVISDAELREANGDGLARAYDLLIFPGHHEYVTEHEYDAVTRYRDLGGNLVFLSADNFYSQITLERGVMHRVNWFRYMHEPESALLGVQYYRNDNGERSGPWIIRPTPAGRWIFAGTGLRPGDRLSRGGIEADEVTSASPRNVEVLAEIVDLYRDHRNAQMTYYTTPRGAEVFSAGAFTLACSSWEPRVSRILSNLIAHMTES